MKKSILTIIIVIILCGCVSTDTGTSDPDKTNQDTNSLDYIKNGEYAFYLDKRGESEYYRGYIKCLSKDKMTLILVRSINKDSSYEEKFMFFIADDENGYPTILKHIAGRISENSTKQTLPDFINYSTIFLATQNDYKTQGYVDDDWGDFILIFNFNKELPFFRLNDIKVKGEIESNYIFMFGGEKLGIDEFNKIDPGIYQK